MAKRSFASSVTDGPLVAKVHFAEGNVWRWATEGHQQLSHNRQPPISQTKGRRIVMGQWWAWKGWKFLLAIFYGPALDWSWHKLSLKIPTPTLLWASSGSFIYFYFFFLYFFFNTKCYIHWGGAKKIDYFFFESRVKKC